ncbi:hypothetical protein Dimus_019506 [Dionaea muscipula]
MVSSRRRRRRPLGASPLGLRSSSSSSSNTTDAPPSSPSPPRQPPLSASPGPPSERQSSSSQPDASPRPPSPKREGKQHRHSRRRRTSSRGRRRRKEANIVKAGTAFFQRSFFERKLRSHLWHILILLLKEAMDTVRPELYENPRINRNQNKKKRKDPEAIMDTDQQNGSCNHNNHNQTKMTNNVEEAMDTTEQQKLSEKGCDHNHGQNEIKGKEKMTMKEEAMDTDKPELSQNGCNDNHNLQNKKLGEGKMMMMKKKKEKEKNIQQCNDRSQSQEEEEEEDKGGVSTREKITRIISEKEKERERITGFISELMNPERCVVGKILDGHKSFSESEMRDRIMADWGLSASGSVEEGMGISIWVVKRNLAVIRFASMEEKTAILDGEARTIEGALWLLRDWSPAADPAALLKPWYFRVARAKLWVHFSGLPFREEEEPRYLTEIASRVGQVLEVGFDRDDCNSPRALVMVEAEGVLPHCLAIDMIRSGLQGYYHSSSAPEVDVTIIYKHVSRSCVKCWRMGHSVEQCSVPLAHAFMCILRWLIDNNMKKQDPPGLTAAAQQLVMRLPMSWVSRFYHDRRVVQLATYAKIKFLSWVLRVAADLRPGSSPTNNQLVDMGVAAAAEAEAEAEADHALVRARPAAAQDHQLQVSVSPQGMMTPSTLDEMGYVQSPPQVLLLQVVDDSPDDHMLISSYNNNNNDDDDNNNNNRSWSCPGGHESSDAGGEGKHKEKNTGKLSSCSLQPGSEEEAMRLLQGPGEAGEISKSCKVDLLVRELADEIRLEYRYLKYVVNYFVRLVVAKGTEGSQLLSKKLTKYEREIAHWSS